MSSKNANKNSVIAINAWERYPDLEKILKDRLVRMGIEPTKANMANYLEVTPFKLGRWEKTQKPSYEDLQILAQKLNLSTGWLLFGTGNPSAEHQEAEFNSEYVAICDTLHEWISLINDSKEVIATIGGMRVEEFEDCISTKKLPPLTAIARWMHHYKLNANHLLAQIGSPFLTPEEYMAPGPIDHQRKKRGDYVRHMPNIDGVNNGYKLPNGEIVKTGPKAEQELLNIIYDLNEKISRLKRSDARAGDDKLREINEKCATLTDKLLSMQERYISVLEENKLLTERLQKPGVSAPKEDDGAHDAPTLTENRVPGASMD